MSTAQPDDSSSLAFCRLCLENIPQTSCVTLTDCNCVFCRPCLRRMVLVNIESKTLNLLHCPAGHESRLTRAEVKRICDYETYLSFLRASDKAAAASDPSRVYCPQPNCSNECRVSPLPGPRPARCIECGWKFCRSCKEKWPGPEHTCPADLHSGITVDTEREETLTDRKGVRVKRCPKCGIPVTRDEGCPQMSCPRCAHIFCWECLADLSKDLFLGHFERGECRQAPQTMWRHRLLSAASMVGLGCVALILSPFLIFCAPCFILCGRDILSGMVDADGEFDNNLMRTFMRREWEQQMSGEDTDDVADDENDITHELSADIASTSDSQHCRRSISRNIGEATSSCE